MGNSAAEIEQRRRNHAACQNPVSKQIAWVKDFIAQGGDHLKAAAEYRRYLAEVDAAKRAAFRQRQQKDHERRQKRKQERRAKKQGKKPKSKPVLHKNVPQMPRKPDRPTYRRGMPTSDFYHCREWYTLRYQTLRRYGCKCMLCSAPANHVDHIKPRSKHPELELDPDNLQILCEACNVGKSNLYEDDWRNRGLSPSPPAME